MTKSVVLVFLCTATLSAQAELQSPDGRLAIAFQTAARNGAASQLVYTVTYQGKPLFEPSALSLDLKDQPPLGANVRIAASTPFSADKTYHLIAGKASMVRDHYNALRVNVEENAAPNRKFSVEARAYDDAVAFRYVVPNQAALNEFRLAKEGTEFRIVKDPTIWALFLPNFRSMYESEFLKLTASALANQGGVKSTQLVGLPLLMHVPGVAWVAITEADLKGYASMYLVNPGGSWNSHYFVSTLAPHLDDPETAVVGPLPHHSAWRVLQVASEPATLIESNVVTSLNPESQIQDTSWIHPGKASWDWWSGSLDRQGKPAYTTDNMKYYVDFAADSGFGYMLIDAGWSARNDITKMNGRVDVPEVVKYAAGKKVKVWIWAAYSSAATQMEQAFPIYENWGVAGVKIDFIERDDQGGIDWYYRAAELAAQHHLMLDFHGATKPTGMERTWPNVLGYEGVTGMEQNKAGARDNPGHEVTLPFTRMLAGEMDYTPGGFRNVTEDEFEARSISPEVMGTRAHQLAMYVVYLAPFQMVSDTPHAYKDQPAFEFIKAAPATWDETHALGGAPGEFVTLARRKGRDWFVGSMTDWTARDLDLPLSFLGPGKYRAEIYADATDAGKYPTNTSIRKQTVDHTMHLKMQLAPGGGYAVRFVPLGQ